MLSLIDFETEVSERRWVLASLRYYGVVVAVLTPAYSMAKVKLNSI